MSCKNRINSHSNLETLPLDELYKSNITEYLEFYESFFSNFFDKYPNFAMSFGSIFYDLAFGKWFYSMPPDSEVILCIGGMPYEKNEPNKDFDIGF